MKIEKKLAARQIIGSAADIKKIVLSLDNGASTNLFRVVGLASRVRHVTTKYGDSVGLRGEFIATRASDGAQFAAIEFFLPDFATQLVMNAINSGKKAENSDDVQVEVAMDIGVTRRDDIAIGYEYTCTPVQPLKASSPLEALIARTNETAPLKLSAPEKAKEPEPPADKEGDKKTGKKK